MVVIHPSFTVPVATRYGRVAVTVLEEQGRPIRVLIQGVPREIAPEAEAMARLIGLLLRTGDRPEGVLQEVARDLEGLGRPYPGEDPALPAGVAAAICTYLEMKSR